VQTPDPDALLLIAGAHVRIHETNLYVMCQGGPLRCRQFRHDVGNDHVEAGQHRVARLDATECTVADIRNVHHVASVANADAGRIEPDTNALSAYIELTVVERRQDHVFHAVARSHRGGE